MRGNGSQAFSTISPIDELEEIAHIGIWEYSILQDKLSTSRQLYRICGLDPDAAKPHKFDLKMVFHPEDWGQVDTVVQEAIHTGVPFDLKCRIVRPDKSIVQVRVRGRVDRDNHGRLSRLFGIVQDLTTSKDNFNESLTLESQYRNFVNHLPGIVFKGRMDFTPQFYYGHVTDITGYSEAELLGGKPRWDKVVHPEDIGQFYSEDELIKTVPKYHAEREYRIIRKDGVVRWVHEDIQNICDAKGRPESVQGFIYDITDRKMIELSLAENAAKFNALRDNSPDGVCLVDTFGHFIDVNQKYCDIMGYSREELLQMSITDLEVNETPIEVHKNLESIAGGISNRFETRNRTKSGQVIDIEVSVSPIIGTNKLVGFVRDITAHKQVDSIVFEANSIILRFDTRGNIKDINDFGAHSLGYERVELVGRPLVGSIIPATDTSGRDLDQMVTDILTSPVQFQRNENENMRKDGSRVWVAWANKPLYDVNGQLFEVLSVGNDITSRKKAEEELQLSEERYRLLFQDSPISLWAEDFSDVKKYLQARRSEGIEDLNRFFLDHPEALVACAGRIKILDVNKATLNIYNAPTKEDLFDNLNSVFTPESYDTFRAEIVTLARGKSVFQDEAITQTLDGRPIFVAIRCQIPREYLNSWERVIISIIDLTEKRRAERGLQESEARFRNLVENSIEGIGISRQNQVLYANKALLDIFGYDTLDEFMKISLLDHVAPESRDDIKKKMRLRAQRNTQSSNYEYTIIRKDGTKRDLEISTYPFTINDELLIQGTFRDITDHKKAERAVQESEAKYRNLVENSLNGISITRGEQILFVNQAMLNILGYSSLEELSKIPFLETVALESRDFVKEKMEERFNGEKVPSQFEYTLLRKDGSKRDVEVLTSVFTLHDEQLVQSTFRDITDRKKAEQARAESETKYRHFFEDAPVGVFRSKIDGSQFLEVNEKFAEIFGYNRDEIFTLGSTKDLWAYPEKRADLIRQLQEKGVIRNHELQVLTKKGDKHTILVSIFLDSEHGLLDGIVVDITDRILLEQEYATNWQKYYNLFNFMSSGVVVYEAINEGADFIIKDFNLAGQRIEKISREEVIGRRVTEVFPGVKDFGLFEVLQRVWYSGIAEHHPIRLYQDNRISGWRENYIYKLPSGEVVAVYDDLTEKQRVEEQLRESETKYRALFENLPVGIGVADLAGNVLDANTAMLDITGFSLPEFKATNLRSTYVHPEARDQFLKQLQEFGRVKDFEVELRRRDGTPYIALVNAEKIQIGKQLVISTNIRDITDRKRAEAKLEQYRTHLEQLVKERTVELRQSEAYYRSLFENSLYGIVVTGPNVKFQQVNAAFCKMLEYDPGELIEKKTIGDITHPEDIPSSKEWMGKLIRREVTQFIIEKRYVTKSGRIINAIVFARGIYDDAGRYLSGTASMLDITARKRAEEELQKHRDRLEELVKARTRELEDKNLKLVKENTERKRAQDLLQQSEEKYHALVDQLNDIIYTTDKDGLFTFVSPAIEKITGKAPYAFLNQSIFKVIIEEDRSTAQDNFPKILSGDSFIAEYRVVVTSGDLRWVRINAKPLKKGEILIGTQGIITDITSQKKVEQEIRQSEAQLSNALMVAHLGPWEYDVGKDEFMFNDLFYRLFRTSAEREGGYTMKSARYAQRFVHPDEISLVGNEIQKAIETTDPHFTQELEHRIIYADGEIGHIIVRYSVVKNKQGRTIKTIGVNQDITDRKRAEEALRESKEQYRRLSEQLEQRVIERTAQLADINNELDAFSSSVSHDLRAPLRIIDGLAEAIIEDYEHKLDSKGADYLARVRVGCKNMANMIDSLLKFSRLSKQGMVLVKVNLSEIAREIANELQRGDQTRNVDFIIKDGIQVTGDPFLLRLVLQNLLENAWKFTSKHSTARIEFGAEDCNGKPVYFVRDDGAGFDTKYVNKLFGPFKRLHDQGEFQGTGIGLATVRRIINRHGGTTWAEGSVEKGATLYFTIPSNPTDIFSTEGV